MNLFSRFRISVLVLALPGALALTGFSQEPPPAREAPPPAAEKATPPPADTPPVEAPKEDDRANLRRVGEPIPDANEPSKRIRSRQRNGGDQFPLGDHTISRGRRTREVVSFLGSTLVEGEVDSDVVSIGGRTTIASGASVGGAAVAVMGRLEMNGRLHQDSVSVMGASSINGFVGGDAVSVLGNMYLGPKAEIDGDLVVVGGTLTKHPDAVVHGEQVHVPFVGGFGDMDWLLRWVKRCVFLGRPLALGEGLGWTWSVAFGFLGFYLLLSVIFPRGIVRCLDTLETRPGSSILWSFLSVLLTPVALILLSITVVGALLVPFLGAGLVFAKLFGKAVMLVWIGRRFTKLFGDGPLNHPVFAVLIGGLLVMLIYTVPLFGFLTYGLLTWLGFGVVIYTIALSMKRDRPPSRPANGEPVVPAPVATASAAAIPSVASFSGASVNPPLGVVAAPVTSAGFSGTAEAPPQISPPPPVDLPPPPPMADVPVAPPSTPDPVPLASAPIFSTARPPVGAVSALPPTATVVWPRAGLMLRLGAMVLDGVLIGMLMAFMYGILPRFMRHDSPGPWLIALALYAAVMWKHKGTTIGGIVCGLKVVRVDNRELDWTTAIVRSLGCFLSLAVAGLGFIWVAIDDEKQSWHDKIAGTTVVRVPKGVSLI